jgi:chromosome segregation ATPase
MSGSYEQQINQLKKGLDQAKEMRSKATASLEYYRKEEERILAELQELGVQPENLEQEIARLKEEIERLLADANRIMPWELLKKGDS